MAAIPIVKTALQRIPSFRIATRGTSRELIRIKNPKRPEIVDDADPSHDESYESNGRQHKTESFLRTRDRQDVKQLTCAASRRKPQQNNHFDL